MSTATTTADNLIHELDAPVVETMNAIYSLYQSEINQLQRATSPTFIHMLGQPGSGKTTLAKALFKELDANIWFWLGFDTIMERIPQYQSDVQTLGAKEAFSHWELPARTFGYRILDYAMQKKVNILFDHSGSNEAHPKILSEAKQIGYQIKVIYPQVSANICRERVQTRNAILGGRQTPIEYVDERIKIIANLLPEYQNLTQIHTIPFENPVGQTELAKILK